MISCTGFFGLLPVKWPTLVELAHAFCSSSARAWGLMWKTSTPDNLVTVLLPERVSRVIWILGALPDLALTVSLVSSFLRMTQKGEQACNMRSMRASRGTLPLAMTSRSNEELPLKTAFARIGFRLTERLFLFDIRFSDSI